jgi:hypothetical protein
MAWDKNDRSFDDPVSMIEVVHCKAAVRVGSDLNDSIDFFEGYREISRNADDGIACGRIAAHKGLRREELDEGPQNITQ